MRWSRILLRLLSADDSQSCTTQINALRQAVGLGEKAYTEISGATPNTDLQEFLAANSCNVLKSGAFNHIAVGPAASVNSPTIGACHLHIEWEQHWIAARK